MDGSHSLLSDRNTSEWEPSTPSFDHLVDAREQSRRHGKAKSFAEPSTQSSKSRSAIGHENVILSSIVKNKMAAKARPVGLGRGLVPTRIGSGLIPACGDIDSCAHAPCQSKTPISHWTAGRFCDGCLFYCSCCIGHGLLVFLPTRRSSPQS